MTSDERKERVKRFIERVGADPNDPVLAQLIEESGKEVTQETYPTPFHMAMRSKEYLEMMVPGIREMDNLAPDLPDPAVMIIAQWLCIMVAFEGALPSDNPDEPHDELFRFFHGLLHGAMDSPYLQEMLSIDADELLSIADIEVPDDLSGLGDAN